MAQKRKKLTKQELSNKVDKIYDGLTSLLKSNVSIRANKYGDIKIKDFDTYRAIADRLSGFSKVYNTMYIDLMSQAVNRYSRISEYDLMEQAPEISSALDIYADECLGPDTIIPLLDGRKLTIKELFDNNEKNFWIYSLDENLNKFVPEKCERVAKNKNKQMYMLTFEDGTKIKSSENHIWVVNGKLIKTKFLKENDSVKNLKTKISGQLSNELNGYEMIFNEDKFEYIHRLVASNNKDLIEQKNNKLNSGKLFIHHSSFNKLNNSPDYLEWVNQEEHNKLHSDFNKKIWSDTENYQNFTEKTRLKHKEYWTEEKRNEKSISHSAVMKKIMRNLSAEERKEKYGNAGEKNGMFNKGYKLLNDKNGRFNKSKNRFCDINFDNYYQDIIDGLSKNELSIKYNLAYDDLLKVNRQICNKYNVKRIDQIRTSHFMEKKWPEVRNKIIYFYDNKIKGDIKNFLISENVNFEYTTKCMRLLNYRGFYDIYQNCNHKLIKIEKLGIEDAYDLVNVGKSHIYAIECNDGSKLFCHNSTTTNENGDVIAIESENDTIKDVLENLFYDILNLDMHVWSTVRNTCKYGDYMWVLNIDPVYGVKGFTAVDPSLIERVEGTEEDPNTIYFKLNTSFGFGSSVFSNNKIKESLLKNNDTILQNWQMAHFRLVSDLGYNPYGRSVLEGARKVWKQLILMEDAMLVYRITRAPERRVFHIDVGSLKPNEIKEYIDKVKNELKRSKIVDQRGNIDLKYNVMPIHKDSIVPLLDGRKITIENLAKEYNEGKTNFVYSIQDNTNEIVPGKIKWCGKNYIAKKIANVYLDDGTIIKVAPEHPFLLRNGNKKRADELLKNDSLMPLYKKNEILFNNKDYEMVYNPASNNYEFIHRIFKKQNNLLIDNFSDKFNNVHHIDCNRYNNRPDNLLLCSRKRHTQLHSDMNTTDLKKKQITEANIKRKSGLNMAQKYNNSWLHKTHNVIRSNAQYKSWSENYENRKKQLKYKFDTNLLLKGLKILSENINIFYNNKMLKKCFSINTLRKKIGPLLKDNKEFLNYFYSIQTIKRKNIHPWSLGQLFIEECNWHNIKNHKIDHVEIIDENVDVYCMTVVGVNNEDDRHNFAVGSCNYNENSYVFVSNSADEDYFLPIRGQKTSSSIETLPGAQNLSEIQDIEYIFKKVMMALKIPLGFMSNETYLNGRCIELNTKIKLLDGRNISLSQIIDEFKNGKENYTYTIDENNNIVAGKIIWAGETKFDKICKIYLDNNEIIECSYDHLFMDRDGKFIEAQNLKENDSLMPLYTKISNKDDNINSLILGYEMLYDIKDNTWKYTHRVIAENCNLINKNEGKVVHHYDFNKLNNNPNNLDCSMNFYEHKKYHADNVKKSMEINKFDFKYYDDKKTCSRDCEKKFRSEYMKGISLLKDNNIKEKINSNKEKILNHKVLKIELTDEYKQMGDLNIDIAPNFALASGIFIHNSTLSMQDYRFSRTITRIQQNILAELEKIAVVHLYILGYRDEELLDFKLSLANPSSLAEEMKLNVFKSRLETAQFAVETKLMDRNKVMKEILLLSDDEIKDIDNGIVRDANLLNAVNPDNMNAGFGMPSNIGGGMGGGLGGDQMLTNPDSMPDYVPQGQGMQNIPSSPSTGTPLNSQQMNVPQLQTSNKNINGKILNEYKNIFEKIEENNEKIKNLKL